MAEASQHATEAIQRLETMVSQAAGIIAGSQNTVGITRAMELVGFSLEERKTMKWYQKVRHKSSKLVVVEVAKGVPVKGLASDEPSERELLVLSIVETPKEYCNILLGQQIEVFTNHKNLVYKTFNTERIMRWRLIIEEFGPKLTYIKRASNIVADALSRMRLTEQDFGPEVFATDAEAGDFPANFPLSYKQLAYTPKARIRKSKLV
jgi:RNase H-like domain found in reverse transcriptase